jgi:outer membrane protein assembly factor BamD
MSSFQPYPGRVRPRSSLALVAIIIGLVFVGCATKPKPAAGDYSGQAKYAYDEGIEAYESSEYIEALKRLNYVRTKFPYSKYAALATLRVGDTYFAQGSMPDATEAYRRFIQLYPTHPDVPYAQHRIGLCYYDQLPGEWFFMPPAHEKDLSSAEDAERALQKFLKLHPNSQYADETREKLTLVRDRLAEHEFYVATFYLKRKKARAAAIRLEALLKRFPSGGYDERALFLLGKSFVLLKDVPRAVEVWEDLIARYPNHPLSSAAAEYIRDHRLSGAKRSSDDPPNEDMDVAVGAEVE